MVGGLVWMGGAAATWHTYGATVAVLLWVWAVPAAATAFLLLTELAPEDGRPEVEDADVVPVP